VKLSWGLGLILAGLFMGGLSGWAQSNDDGSVPLGSQSSQEPAVLQPGYQLKITVYREPDLNGTYEVDERGMLTFPLVGDINTRGLTIDGLKGEIAQRLRKFIVDPQLTISVEKEFKGELGMVAVLGQVRNSGVFEAPEGKTLMRFIAGAGGLSERADPLGIRVIRVLPDGQQQLLIYDIEQIQAGEGRDPVIVAGDKIIVPELETAANTVSVFGQVKGVGVYPVEEGFTLMRVLAQAGGFTPIADQSKVRIVRKVEGEKKIYVFDARKIIKGYADDVPIEEGDIIFVPESFF